MTDEQRTKLREFQKEIEKAGRAVAKVRLSGGDFEAEQAAWERLEAAKNSQMDFLETLGFKRVSPRT